MHAVTVGIIPVAHTTSFLHRKLFSTRMKSQERGGSIVKHPILPTASNRDSIGSKSIGKKRPLSPSQEEKPSKRVSIKLPSRAGTKSISGGKIAGGKKAARPSGKKIAASPSKLKINLNAPVPMHVAIASIKESYPGRRQAKDLEGWEADCIKYLKQLQRHPWISAERPKVRFLFIYCTLLMLLWIYPTNVFNHSTSFMYQSHISFQTSEKLIMQRSRILWI